jgi:hypothetical protein
MLIATFALITAVPVLLAGMGAFSPSAHYIGQDD